MELPDRRPRGRSKRRFMEKEEKERGHKLVGLREEDAEDRVRWRRMIHCGDP